MVKIRPINFTAADFEHESIVWNDVWPHEQRLPHEMEHTATRGTGRMRSTNYLAETMDGIPVGRGVLFIENASIGARKQLVRVMVRPAWRGQGIGRALSARLEQQIAISNPDALITQTYENETDGLRMLKKLGFECKQRMPVSEIEVAAFDSAEFLPALTRIANRNITITTFDRLCDELGSDTAWSRMYQLRLAIAPDIPHYDPNQSYPSKEAWLARQTTHPTILHDGTFIALHRGNWIGVSQLYERPAMPGLLDQGITGVRRAYRRMGVATALKLRTLDLAQRRGASVIRTDNEENNPMYQLNLRLGFRPKPALLIFEKRKKSEE